MPLKRGFGLHGLALFYFGASDPLPGPALLDHVSLMARALGAWFVVRRGQTLEANAQAAPTLGVGSRYTLAPRSVPQVVDLARSSIMVRPLLSIPRQSISLWTRKTP